jgi:hypothetical protein
MSDQTKLIDRIKALLAKAKGTDNEHEADAFMAKAMALMEEHQIDLTQLDDAADPIAERAGMEQGAGSHVWVTNLYCDLARLYGARTYFDNIWTAKGRRVRIQVIGRESAKVTLDLMHPFVVQQVREQAKRLAPLTGMSVQGQAKRIGAALRHRIWKMIREQESAEGQAIKTEAARKNALVTTNQTVALYEQITQGFETKKGGRSVTDGLARAAAGQVSLARQMGGGNQLKLGSK